MSTCSNIPFHDSFGNLDPEFFSCYLNKINYVLLVFWLIKYTNTRIEVTGFQSSSVKYVFMILCLLISPFLYEIAIAFFYFFFCGVYPWALAIGLTYSLHAMSYTSQKETEDNRRFLTRTDESRNLLESNYLFEEGSRNLTFNTNIFESFASLRFTEQNTRATDTNQTSNGSVQSGPTSQSRHASFFPFSHEKTQLLTSNLTSGRAVSQDQQGISQNFMCIPERRNSIINACKSTQRYPDTQVNMQKNKYEIQRRPRSADGCYTNHTVVSSTAYNQLGSITEYHTEPQISIPSHLLSGASVAHNQPGISLDSRNLPNSVLENNNLNLNKEVVSLANVTDERSKNKKRVTAVQQENSLLSRNLLNAPLVVQEQQRTSDLRNLPSSVSENNNLNLNQELESLATANDQRRKSKKQVTADQQENSLLASFMAIRRGTIDVNHPENLSEATSSNYEESDTSTSAALATKRKTPVKRRKRKTAVNYHPPKARKRKN